MAQYLRLESCLFQTIVESLGAADQTMADPLAEGKMVEGLEEEEKEEEALKPFISDDEEEDGKPTQSTKIHVDVSAYMSEDDEDGAAKDDNEASSSSDSTVPSPRRRTFEMESPSTAGVRPPLARERTFEMESPSKEGIRPPLARERTFEMESPSTEGVRPPLARERTFEMESPSEGIRPPLARERTFEKDSRPSLDSPRRPSTRRRTFEMEEGAKDDQDIMTSEMTFSHEENTTDAQVNVDPMPTTLSPVSEFSILQDETSGLSAEELKARIMASIAVSPSALAADATAGSSAGAASRHGIDNANAKSCSKDWKKIHSTNDNRMESLVDFYQRKRKRADDAQKSAQKSAKLSAAQRAAVAASLKDRAAPAKSARTLAFSKPTAGRSEKGAVAQPASSATTSHYGTKPGHFVTSKIHFPTSEGVSEVSERGNK